MDEFRLKIPMGSGCDPGLSKQDYCTAFCAVALEQGGLVLSLKVLWVVVLVGSAGGCVSAD